MYDKLEIFRKTIKKLNDAGIEASIIEDADVKKATTIIDVKNDNIEDMYIKIIDKKNSSTIYLLYYYYEYEWPNVWLMSSTDVTDVIDKIKKLRRGE